MEKMIGNLEKMFQIRYSRAVNLRLLRFMVRHEKLEALLLLTE